MTTKTVAADALPAGYAADADGALTLTRCDACGGGIDPDTPDEDVKRFADMADTSRVIHFHHDCYDTVMALPPPDPIDADLAYTTEAIDAATDPGDPPLVSWVGGAIGAVALAGLAFTILTPLVELLLGGPSVVGFLAFLVTLFTLLAVAGAGFLGGALLTWWAWDAVVG